MQTEANVVKLDIVAKMNHFFNCKKIKLGQILLFIFCFLAPADSGGLRGKGEGYKGDMIYNKGLMLNSNFGCCDY